MNCWKLIIPCLLFLVTITANAQQRMSVYTTDGKVVYFPISMVDSIDFSTGIKGTSYDSIEIVSPDIPILYSRKTIRSGDTFFGDETFIRKNTFLTFNIKNNGTAHLLAGRGYNDYSGNWLEITSDSVFVHRRTTSDIILSKLPHHLALGSQIRVGIYYKEGSTANINIESCGQSFDFNAPWWAGGAMFVSNMSDGDVLATMSLYALDAEEPLWIVGDSYINWQDANRWPYYLYREGYSNWLGDHLPGAGSTQMLQSFINDLKLGKPKYAVWCLGMNDRQDSDNRPSEVWLNSIRSFITVCEQNGITPILTTVPSVPKRNHKAKSAWVRKSGYTYIDISQAVSDNDSPNWFSDYLSADNIHPSATGAKVIADKVTEVLKANLIIQ